MCVNDEKLIECIYKHHINPAPMHYLSIFMQRRQIEDHEFKFFSEVSSQGGRIYEMKLKHLFVKGYCKMSREKEAKSQAALDILMLIFPKVETYGEMVGIFDQTIRRKRNEKASASVNSNPSHPTSNPNKSQSQPTPKASNHERTPIPVKKRDRKIAVKSIAREVVARFEKKSDDKFCFNNDPVQSCAEKLEITRITEIKDQFEFGDWIRRNSDQSLITKVQETPVDPVPAVNEKFEAVTPTKPQKLIENTMLSSLKKELTRTDKKNRVKRIAEGSRECDTSCLYFSYDPLKMLQYD